MVLVYAGLIGLTVFEFSRAPTGFIPQQDQGYLINIIQLPPGASLARTDEVARRVNKIVLDTPGVAHAVPIVGLDGATFTNAPNAAVIFTPARSLRRARQGRADRATMISMLLNQKFAAGPGGASSSACRRRRCAASAPPAASRWRCRTPMAAISRSSRAWRRSVVGAANQTPGLTSVFTTFNTRTPKIWADIDRVRAEMLGVRTDDVFTTLEVYLGSQYVNDFNFLGRTYRVTAQADGQFRQDLHAISQLKTRNANGEMVPLGSVAAFRDITGPYRVEHFNLFPSAAVQGGTLPGYSTGYGLAAMEQDRRAAPARRLRLRMDRDRLSGAARRQHRDLRVRSPPWCSCSCCSRRNMKAGRCRSPSSSSCRCACSPPSAGFCCAAWT